MAKRNPYALKSHHFTIDEVLVDKRNDFDRFFETLFSYPVAPGIVVGSMVATAIIPGLFPISVLISLVLLAGHQRLDILPIALPEWSKASRDRNTPAVGGKGFMKPSGAFFLGTLLHGLPHQIFLRFDSLLRHILVIGTTGSGKTELLLGIVTNFLSYGAGVIFNDAKGTLALFVQNRTIARAFGRDWDVRLINYNKGSGTAKDDAAKIVSNTSAPFSVGNADANIQLITASLSTEGGNNKVFQEAAFSLIAALMPTLVELRDIGYLTIDPQTLRRYTNWDEFCSLTENEYIPAKMREGLLQFIKSRSGFDPSKAFNKQSDQPRQQFGYAQAYFVRQFSTLSDSYGNIYSTGAGEVDYRDVFMNNRILITLLPSLEKSSSELQNLGSLTLSAQKSALSMGLGSTVVGRTADVIDSLPMQSNIPNLLITDEASYIIVEGEAVKVAQARGLKVVILLAVQDFAGLKRANEAESEQIFANTRLKIILSSEADKGTFDLITQVVGKVWVYVKKGLERVEGSMFDSKRAQATYGLEQIDPVTPDDIRALNEGEGIVFFQEKRHYFRTFFHGFTREKFPENVRLVELLETNFRPSRGTYKEFLQFSNKRFREDTYRLIDGWPERQRVSVPKSERIDAMRTAFDAAIKTTKGPYSPEQIGCMLINSYASGKAFLDVAEPAPEQKSTLLFGNMSGDFGGSRPAPAATPTPRTAAVNPVPDIAAPDDLVVFPDATRAPSVFASTQDDDASEASAAGGRILDFDEDSDADIANAPTTATTVTMDPDEEEDEFTQSILNAASGIMARARQTQNGYEGQSDEIDNVVDELMGEDFEVSEYQTEATDVLCDDGDLVAETETPTTILSDELVSTVRRSTIEIERALGKPEMEAVGVGDSWAKKIVAETSYPQEKVDKSSILEAMHAFNRKFNNSEKF